MEQWKRLKRFTVVLRPINYKLRYLEFSRKRFSTKQCFIKTASSSVSIVLRRSSEHQKITQQAEMRLTQLSKFLFLIVSLPLLIYLI